MSPPAPFRKPLGIVPLVLVTVLSGMGSAHSSPHTYSGTVIGPAGPGEFTGGACVPDDTIFLVDCNSGGRSGDTVSAIDVRDLDGALEYVHGTCTVTPGSPNTNNFVGNGAYSFLCGVDRDDDGFVTDYDRSCGIAEAGGCASDPDGYDDDFASGSVNSPNPPPSAQVGSTIDVCLRRDNAEGGGDWDDVWVFVTADAPSAPSAAGIFDVSLSLWDDSTCNGAPVSGHSGTSDGTTSGPGGVVADVRFGGVGQPASSLPCSSDPATSVQDCRMARAVVDVSNLGGQYSFAWGTCTVEPGKENTARLVQDGGYSFECGVDRDDDGLLTNADRSCNLLGQGCSSDPDGYDDDFALGNGSDPASVCFRRDRSTLSGARDTDAHGDWDDVFVFVTETLPSVQGDTGVFHVSLSLQAGASGCPDDLSGHTHDSYFA